MAASPARAKSARLAQIHRDARECRACPLWRDATQTVFGEGPPGARIVLVGKQPGDQEDLAGHPFVGPAGRMLDRAIELVGLDRSAMFLTNGVKHFKFKARGKRRIHQRPGAGEVTAYRPWLEAELGVIEPAVIVALGASAAHALLGRATPIGKNRGRLLEGEISTAPVLITTHPSSILRERERRHAALLALAEDLKLAGGC